MTPDHAETTQAEPESVEELVAQWEDEKPPAAGPVTNIATGALVALLGVAGVIGSRSLGLGSASQPGPGTWPLVISVGLILLGLLLVVRARTAGFGEKFSVDSWRVASGLASMIAFTLLIGNIGFEIPAALLAFFWLKVLGNEGWRSSLIGAVLMPVVFYLIFVTGLSTNIPHLF
ncbi:tripartite tricarboxylate transporter TctB family protein [Aeromicrobium alkaliterrae]|uniref:Tripartite tricarboxylate transporter TctB family protein n=1 Tax=Aeromicrobium alkaliterrae TaxID=302168 RepID=A0ABN2JFQ1_9ACTN